MIKSDSISVLGHPVTSLPDREWRSLGRVASLEEPEPLSHQSVSTNITLPYHATNHRHILPNVYISRILGDTGGGFTDARIRDIAKIGVVLNLGLKRQLSCLE